MEWVSQNFETWKEEIETWSKDSKASEENKYVNLLETLKKE